MPSTSIFRATVLFSLLASVLGHTALNFPLPRGPKQSYAFEKVGNACENGNTAITEKTVFKRGAPFEPSWWWNNHDGGFVKFALVKGTGANVDNKLFLENKNIIAAQCYNNGCDRNGFDPGFTHLCKGTNMVIPDWVADGEYTLQFSQIGGFNSDGIPTKQLPLYHNCANIKVAGGVALKPQPTNWIAPFTGGSQDVISGKKGGNDVCGFKAFNAEPADPTKVNVNKDVNVNNMQFGKPAGWAVAGKTQAKREDNLRLPRLGRVARVRDEVEEQDGEDEYADQE